MEVHEVARNLEQVAPQVGEVAILLVPVAPTRKVNNLPKVVEADILRAVCVQDQNLPEMKHTHLYFVET